VQRLDELRRRHAESVRNRGGENRVLIMSDGVANLGTMEAADILKGVETYRKQGIFCSVFGVGIGTYNDEMLQQLANKGDGSYTFIDSEEEARRVLVDDLSATLNTIAKDVKIQVEFNPATVKRYRQLGYESRQLKKEDFRNDTVDAGEVGSGQSVTALYELEAAAGAGVQRSVFSVQDSEVRSQRSEVRSQNLGEQSSFGTRHSALGIVRVRYKRTDNGKVEEIEQPIMADQIVKRFDDADSRFRLAACAAEFSEILRSSPFAEGNDFDGVANALRPVALDLGLDFRVQEFLRLVQSAKGMPRGE
jgi:Ca-activated chloride channel family protein